MRAKTKDFVREIKHTFSRYLSIAAIVALGVTFYSGIKSSELDMQMTADDMYDKQNFMDLRVLGTHGLTDEDVLSISGVQGIKEAEGGYSYDLLCRIGDKEHAMLTYSYGSQINKPIIEEGRLPQGKSECFLDSSMMLLGKEKIQIGDKITLLTGDERALSDILYENEFTVVGYGTIPNFLSWDRGTISIATGKANGFVLLAEEAFVADYYTVVYATVDGAMEMNGLSDEYHDLIDIVAKRVEEIGTERAEIRRRDIVERTLEEYKEDFINGAPDVLTQKYYLVQFNSRIDEIRTEIEEKIGEAKWYVLDRNTIANYVEYSLDTSRIAAISRVVPIIFYLVAMLVSLTTITRMVEEQRTQIGTMKALGYGKNAIAAKYLGYALSATVLGCVIGVFGGGRLLSWTIVQAYMILYTNMFKIQLINQWDIALSASAIALGCEAVTIAGACFSTLAQTPANLMRPAAPKVGKRVFLEYITFFWNRLSFITKATLRNLFRYKKRFLMTVLGIGGCMGLLLVGFGLRDSIKKIVESQYKSIWHYDAVAQIDERLSEEERKALLEEINSFNGVSEEALVVSNILYNATTLRTDEAGSNPADSGSSNTVEGDTVKDEDAVTKEVYTFVTTDKDGIEAYISFHERISKETHHLTDDGVIISEKLAKMFKLKVGDEFVIKPEESREVKVKVSAIVENYLYYYVYMTETYYRETFGDTPNYNQIILQLSDSSTTEAQDEFARHILAMPEVNSFTYIETLENKVSEMMKSMDLVIWVIILAAGLLNFVVIYNLNNINLIERRRELATIKVLGFYTPELAMYVYRENVYLTIFGMIAGVFIGKYLHAFIIQSCEIDMIMFGRQITAASYLSSVALTALFAVLVNLFMLKKLRQIDMVESLKSVD